jgi:hypothetical protein
MDEYLRRAMRDASSPTIKRLLADIAGTNLGKVSGAANSVVVRQALETANSPMYRQLMADISSPAAQQAIASFNSPGFQRTRESFTSRTWESQIDLAGQIYKSYEIQKHIGTAYATVQAHVFRSEVQAAIRAFDSSYLRRLIDDSLGLVTSVSIPSREKILDFLRDEETRQAFSFAGMVPSPYTDEKLRHRVVSNFKAGDTPENIQQLILTHYDARNAGKVSQIVRRLKRIAVFKSRKEVLIQTLQAHREGLDAITTYPVAAMIEGVLRPYLMSIESRI